MSKRNTVAVVWVSAVFWWIMESAFQKPILIACAVLATFLAIIITLLAPNDTDDESVS